MTISSTIRDRQYMVAAGFTHSNNLPGRDGQSQARDLHINGGRVKALYNSVPDGDGDCKFYLGDSRTQAFYVNLRYVSEITETTPVVSTVSATEAYRLGNVIEFTVSGITFNGTMFTKGCKSASLADADVMSALVKFDREAGTATFRTEVKQTNSGTPYVGDLGKCVVGPDDARQHFTDIKIISTPVPVMKSIQISDAEARVLMAIAGHVGGTPGGFRGVAENALKRIVAAHDLTDYEGFPEADAVRGNLIFND